MITKVKNSRLNVKPSSEWTRVAPAGATALIVAECATKEHSTPQRRIALDWVYGERTKAAPLRSAAAKLQDTAPLAEAGVEAERLESDGSMALCSPVRGQVRWTVRSIPLGLLMCWAGFEDGMNSPVHAVPAEIEAAEPALVAEVTAPPATAPSALTSEQKSSTSATPPLPVQEKPALESERKAAGNESMSLTAPLPVFAPMAALILNRKPAFAGNCAAPNGKFITDGRLLLVRAACADAFTAKLKTTKVGIYGPDSPVPDSTAQKMFDTTIQTARYEAHIAGFILGASAGTSDTDEPLVCSIGPDRQIEILNGHRLLLIQNVTGANRIMSAFDERCGKVVFFRGNEPVAVLITMVSEEVKKLFERIIEATNSRTQVTRLVGNEVRKAS